MLWMMLLCAVYMREVRAVAVGEDPGAGGVLASSRFKNMSEMPLCLQLHVCSCNRKILFY